MEEKEWQFMGDQEKIYNELLQPGSIFIDGAAGTGKSELIKKYAQDMRDKGKNVIVTAPTGIAAQKINGTTVHRAFGYNIGPKDVRGIDSSDVFKLSDVLKNADIVIIDEVSMLRVDIFELFFYQVLRTLQLRKANFEAGVEKEYKPIEIKLIGDFRQLPPVYTGDKGQRYKYNGIWLTDIEYLKKVYNNESLKAPFAFESQCWNALNLKYSKLRKIIRQKDPVLVGIINALKNGNEYALNWFNDNCTVIDKLDLEDKQYDKYVILCSTRQEVSGINDTYISLLPGEEKVFTEDIEYYQDGITIGENDRIADQVVKLKVGARVQCLVNEKDGAYQNGSLGTVLSIGKDYAEVQLDSGSKVIVQVCKMPVNIYSVTGGKTEITKVADIKQIPLRLAKAMTVHKAQGQTFDYVIVKSDQFFDGSQYTVALSRCTTKDGLVLLGKLNLNRVSRNGKSYRVNLQNFTVQTFYNNHIELRDEEDEYGL